MLNGVPIIGAKPYVNFCQRGHRELASGPFTFDLPGPDGQILKQQVCRPCLLHWFAWTMPANTMALAAFEKMSGVTLGLDGTWQEVTRGPS